MERKITIEEHVLYKEDYQMKMLKANLPEGFLKVAGRGMNGSSYYDYDVSGKISMQAMYTRAKLKAEDIRQFMYQFGNVLKETGKYLLDIHCILLEPEYIFYEEGQFFFCYYPPATQDLWEKDMEKPVRKTMIDELLEEKRERTSYYDTEEHDWITEQEMGSSIMRETDNLWIPVKRFLNKHKKTKWGEWDGLHIEEEEL